MEESFINFKVNDYVFLEFINKGSFGKVYKAIKDNKYKNKLF